jgi:hypothetical protein
MPRTPPPSRERIRRGDCIAEGNRVESLAESEPGDDTVDNGLKKLITSAFCLLQSHSNPAAECVFVMDELGLLP